MTIRNQVAGFVMIIGNKVKINGNKLSGGYRKNGQLTARVV